MSKQTDEGLIIVAPFLPSPLIEKRRRGFASKVGAAQARIGWFTSGVKLIESFAACPPRWLSSRTLGSSTRFAVASFLPVCLPGPAGCEVTVIKSLSKGDYLFREGDPASGFYVIQRVP